MTLLECVFLGAAANQVPLWSGTAGNHLTSLGGCEVRSAEALERHATVLGGHIVPLLTCIRGCPSGSSKLTMSFPRQLPTLHTMWEPGGPKLRTLR